MSKQNCKDEQDNGAEEASCKESSKEKEIVPTVR